MKHLTHISVLAASLFLSSHVVAQTVAITNSWVRATVQGQKATGAFMTVTSKENAKLVTVSSPVAGIVEIHEMKMDKDVMKMSALPNGLDLPAGKAVDLKPGGFHIMLMENVEVEGIWPPLRICLTNCCHCAVGYWALA